MIKRSKLVPVMQLFDAPEPLVSQGKRMNTTIAPQALMFMNSSNVRGYARSLAEKLSKKAGVDIEEAVVTGYETVLGREPYEDELSATVEFLKAQEDSYAQAKQVNPRELALTDFAQTLFGLNEFSYLR
jgi:hypothetical protein